MARTVRPFDHFLSETPRERRWGGGGTAGPPRSKMSLEHATAVVPWSGRVTFDGSCLPFVEPMENGRESPSICSSAAVFLLIVLVPTAGRRSLTLFLSLFRAVVFFSVFVATSIFYFSSPARAALEGKVVNQCRPSDVFGGRVGELLRTRRRCGAKEKRERGIEREREKVRKKERGRWEGSKSPKSGPHSAQKWGKMGSLALLGRRLRHCPGQEDNTHTHTRKRTHKKTPFRRRRPLRPRRGGFSFPHTERERDPAASVISQDAVVIR